MAELIPYYLMPGTYVNVYDSDEPIYFMLKRFRIPGRPDGTYRAITFTMTGKAHFGDYRRWLGGRRFKGYHWEYDPDFPRRDLDPQPVETPQGTWVPTGYLTSPREAKKSRRARPLNEHHQLMGNDSLMDWAVIEEQKERALAARTYSKGVATTTTESDTAHGKR